MLCKGVYGNSRYRAKRIFIGGERSLFEAPGRPYRCLYLLRIFLIGSPDADLTAPLNSFETRISFSASWRFTSLMYFLVLLTLVICMASEISKCQGHCSFLSRQLSGGHTVCQDCCSGGNFRSCSKTSLFWNRFALFPFSSSQECRTLEWGLGLQRYCVPLFYSSRTAQSSRFSLLFDSIPLLISLPSCWILSSRPRYLYESPSSSSFNSNPFKVMVSVRGVRCPF